MNNKIRQIQEDIITYFKGIKIEWGKITWPEKRQVVVETVFVIAIVMVFTGFIFFVDVIFEEIFKLIQR